MNYYQCSSAFCTPRGTVYYGSDGKPMRIEERLSANDADQRLWLDALKRVTGTDWNGTGMKIEDPK